MVVECVTDIGAVRKMNQDAFAYGIIDDSHVWAVVCDGMGGANGGNIASAMAVEEIKAHVTSVLQPGISAGNIKAMINNAISKANAAVFDKANETPELVGMGTTAVVVVVAGSKLYIAHVGDSRAYLYSNDELERLTVDHSYVQNLINFGQLTENEAKNHPQRNIITRAIGVHTEIAADYIVADFKPGDKLIACTDGLTNHVEDVQLFEIISEEDGKDLVTALVDEANANGGSDNITVALIENV